MFYCYVLFSENEQTFKSRYLNLAQDVLKKPFSLQSTTSMGYNKPRYNRTPALECWLDLAI